MKFWAARLLVCPVHSLDELTEVVPNHRTARQLSSHKGGESHLGNVAEWKMTIPEHHRCRSGGAVDMVGEHLLDREVELAVLKFDRAPVALLEGVLDVPSADAGAPQ